MNDQIQTPAQADFKTFLVLTKGLQPVTVKNHLGVIRRAEAKVGALTLAHAQQYVADTYQSDASYSHKYNTVTAIEHYLEWAGTPFRFARQKKPRPLVVPVLSEADITAMVLACRDLRDKALLVVLANSAVRPKELCQLRVSDVDAAHNQIRVVNGKGMKDRAVHVPAPVSALLHEYLKASGKVADERLFTTKREGLPFSQSALRKFVRRLARRAGIKRRMYPYLLRHSLATHMVVRGAPLLAVKQQLGHVYLETTYRYVSSLGYDPESQYDRFFPAHL